MGIGWLFGFVGYFHNQTLGSYNAYAHHGFNTVVMVFDGETIVVMPNVPRRPLSRRRRLLPRLPGG